MTCKHMNFHATVNVARLEDIGGFSADITIKCQDCDKPFQFLGLEPGLDLQGARCSIDGLEARIGICPENERPNPLQKMMFNISKFSG